MSHLENLPEQQLSDLLKPVELSPNIFESAQALGGIGLGDIESTALPAGSQNKRSGQGNTLSPLSPELQETANSIREQLVTSLQAYGQFNKDCGLPSEDIATVESKLDETILEWASNGSLEYIKQQQEADPELSFDLVINTREVLSHGTLFKVANAFARGQDDWDEAYISKDFLEKYADEELSGPPATGVRFSLIPTKYTIQPNRALEQLLEFKQLQRDSSANLIISSMKDAIAWWYVKRQQQREASGNPDKQLDVNNYKDTFIRHIDLKPVKVGSVSALPGSCVHGGGQPFLTVPVVEDAEGVRVAVG